MNPSGAERFKPETVAETPPPNSLGNLEAENKALKGQLDTVTQKLAVAETQITDSEADRARELPSHQLHTEIEQLKERNRLLLIKSREERQKLEEEISALKFRDESQSRRLQEKQARLDELEIQIEKAQIARPELETAIDLSEQIAEIVNFLKQLLPPDTKWPKRVIPELRKFLESKED